MGARDLRESLAAFHEERERRRVAHCGERPRLAIISGRGSGVQLASFTPAQTADEAHMLLVDYFTCGEEERRHIARVAKRFARE